MLPASCAGKLRIAGNLLKRQLPRVMPLGLAFVPVDRPFQRSLKPQPWSPAEARTRLGAVELEEVGLVRMGCVVGEPTGRRTPKSGHRRYDRLDRYSVRFVGSKIPASCKFRRSTVKPLSEPQVPCERLKHMLPRTHCVRITHP